MRIIFGTLGEFIAETGGLSFVFSLIVMTMGGQNSSGEIAIYTPWFQWWLYGSLAALILGIIMLKIADALGGRRKEDYP